MINLKRVHLRHFLLVALLIGSFGLLAGCGKTSPRIPEPSLSVLETVSAFDAQSNSPLSTPPLAATLDSQTASETAIAPPESFGEIGGVLYDAGITDVLYPGEATTNCSKEDLCTRWLPSLGAEDAAVTVIEFSELGCSHCRAFNSGSLPGILEEYVATGKVRFVSHYMTFGSQDSLAFLNAAMCAAEQGLYFEYKHAVYTALDQGSFDLSASALEIDLDDDRFVECFSASRYDAAVQDAKSDALNSGVSATPTFLVNGTVILGNDPVGIQREIEDILSLVTSADNAGNSD